MGLVRIVFSLYHPILIPCSSHSHLILIHTHPILIPCASHTYLIPIPHSFYPHPALNPTLNSHTSHAHPILISHTHPILIPYLSHILIPYSSHSANWYHSGGYIVDFPDLSSVNASINAQNLVTHLQVWDEYGIVCDACHTYHSLSLMR